MPERMPAIFFGHGNPLNALLDNDHTKAWSQIGARVRRPRAILSISAHWYVPRTAVTAIVTPRTIHDFGGFPRELYQVSISRPAIPSSRARCRDSSRRSACPSMGAGASTTVLGQCSVMCS